MKVKVVISGGKIASVEVVENHDDSSYLNRAKALIGNIISSQSTNVDVISGATYSSNGIKSAVRGRTPSNCSKRKFTVCKYEDGRYF